MQDNTSEGDRKGSQTPDWLNNLKGKNSLERAKQLEKEEEEEVVKHTPSREKEPEWKYTIKEGGQIYTLNFPTTEEKIKEVETHLLNPRNWRRYKRHPQGGHRNYTQVNCFPPFDFLRLAELYMPDGRVWKSRTRKFHSTDK